MSTKILRHPCTIQPKPNPEVAEIPFRLRGNHAYLRLFTEGHSPFVLECTSTNNSPTDEQLERAASGVFENLIILHHTTQPRGAGLEGNKVLLLGIPKDVKKDTRVTFLENLYRIVEQATQTTKT